MYLPLPSSSSTENLLPRHSTLDMQSHTHQYSPPEAGAHRAPCPGLNTLANHGYIPRSGTNITFINLLSAVTQIYNLSLPLTLLLALPAFIIYGRLHLPSKTYYLPWTWSYTLDLADLAEFGPYKIAHQASLVHPNHPSHAADPGLLFEFLSFAKARGEKSPSSSSSPSAAPTATVIPTHDIPPPSPTLSPRGTLSGGLSLFDLATIRVSRESQLTKPLSTLHEQIALGESALTWLVFYEREEEKLEIGEEKLSSYPRPNINVSNEVDLNDATILLDRLAAWFGQERLPDRWFEDVRPKKTIGLLEARRVAERIQKDMEIVQWKKEGRFKV
ncbi:hypothetical protein D9758_006171 [Tetrapyrgos nigripes]|uniref:Heme haloperoxidase family profile domain-containing protein n=1 Tax=Tetrapyrgos nigripes TaxID=182062 RepID=A0A8H5LLI6_9AGAR|nr:hypothetical protein D9758_006171 [Tetrapyrgos nigripes]